MRRFFAFFICLAIAKDLNANHNFYIGVTAISNLLTGKRSDLVKNVNDETAIFAENKGINTSNIYGGAFAGYFFRVENFGIGPEIFYNHGKLENTISDTHIDAGALTDTAFDITHKISNQFGLNIKLGYFLNSYFLYTLFGVHSQTNQFSVKAKQNAVRSIYNYSYATKKQNNNAFSFGLGIQKSIAEHYAIGLECKFSKFLNKDFLWNLGDANETTLTSSFKYQLRSIGLKLMYVF